MILNRLTVEKNLFYLANWRSYLINYNFEYWGHIQSAIFLRQDKIHFMKTLLN